MKPEDENRIVTCHGCIQIDPEDSENGVGWCKFHRQYRSLRTPRECELAIFDLDAAVSRLAAYIRAHAVPPFNP